MNWLKQLFLGRRLDDELRQEIAFHLEKENRRTGRQRHAGQASQGRCPPRILQCHPIEERYREAWQWPTLESFWADIELTAHQLRRSPVFTITAVATLALGIGANTAIFSVINSVLLKPLSYPEPNRIVQFLLTLPEGPRPSASISDFRLWQQQTQAFEQVSAYDFSPDGMTLAGEPPQQVRAIHVTSDYFRLFGAPMLLGRTFTAEEASPAGGKVVVLSYGLWKSRFGGDPDIVGKSISLRQRFLHSTRRHRREFSLRSRGRSLDSFSVCSQ